MWLSYSVVATPTLVPNIVWQQWICAAISGVVKPKNDAMICIVSAVGSSTTATEPAPGEVLGGTSFAPDRIPPKVIGIACAAGAGSIRAVNASKQDRIGMRDSFMFASFAEEKNWAQGLWLGAGGQALYRFKSQRPLDNISLRTEYYHDEQGQRTSVATRYPRGWARLAALVLAADRDPSRSDVLQVLQCTRFQRQFQCDTGAHRAKQILHVVVCGGHDLAFLIMEWAGKAVCGKLKRVVS
jgi:hypothetical protein